MSDRTEHISPSDERRGMDMEDRAALEKRLADARISIRARIQRIEREVGPGPQAIWAGARKRPVVSLLAASAAGLLLWKLLFRRCRPPARSVDAPAAPAGSQGLHGGLPVGSAGPGGGARYLFWATLLQTGLGIFADAAADFFARRSGAGRISRENRWNAGEEGAKETQNRPSPEEAHSSGS